VEGLIYIYISIVINLCKSRLNRWKSDMNSVLLMEFEKWRRQTLITEESYTLIPSY